MTRNAFLAVTDQAGGPLAHRPGRVVARALEVMARLTGLGAELGGRALAPDSPQQLPIALCRQRFVRNVDINSENRI